MALDIGVIQVTNIAPNASLEQMQTLFSHMGEIKEIQLYPSEYVPFPMFLLYHGLILHISLYREGGGQQASKICYIKYADPTSAMVAQHLTNTVFIDRALIVLSHSDDKIPDSSTAQQNVSSSGFTGGSNSGLVSQVVAGVGGAQVITTIDPRLTALGLPQYPPLPANMDPAKIEEIRRTVYVGNLDSTATAEQLLKFFNQIGEVKFVRMAGDESQPTRFAFIEFTEQSSVANALQYNTVNFNGRPLKINHSNNAIVKPQTKSTEAAQKEIEEAMKRVREAQSLISQAIDPGFMKFDNSAAGSGGGMGMEASAAALLAKKVEMEAAVAATRSKSRDKTSRDRERERSRDRRDRSVSRTRRSRTRSPRRRGSVDRARRSWRSRSRERERERRDRGGRAVRDRSRDRRSRSRERARYARARRSPSPVVSRRRRTPERRERSPVISDRSRDRERIRRRSRDRPEPVVSRSRVRSRSKSRDRIREEYRRERNRRDNRVSSPSAKLDEVKKERISRDRSPDARSEDIVAEGPALPPTLVDNDDEASKSSSYEPEVKLVPEPMEVDDGDEEGSRESSDTSASPKPEGPITPPNVVLKVDSRSVSEDDVRVAVEAELQKEEEVVKPETTRRRSRSPATRRRSRSRDRVKRSTSRSRSERSKKRSQRDRDRSRSRDRRREHKKSRRDRDRRSDKDVVEASRSGSGDRTRTVQRDYDEEEKGYDSGLEGKKGKGRQLSP